MINAMKDQTLKWCNRLGFNDPRRGFRSILLNDIDNI